MNRIYAAGDASAQPVKQGGLAAQQADAAAAGIARLAGAEVETRPYRPVIRAALLTGSLPLFLRKSGVAGQVAKGPIWSPPAKLAGRYLAPYLDRRVRTLDDGQAFEDFVRPPSEDDEEQEAMAELALLLAEEDAQAGERRRAVEWLDAATAVRGGILPEEYAEKRRRCAGSRGAPG